MHTLNSTRPCDTCLFMADTFHPEMCLHPARRDEGELGKQLDYALLWNGDCPVQHVGRPAFYMLLDVDLPVEAWETAGEDLRGKIAEHLERDGCMTQQDIEGYVKAYRSFGQQHDERRFVHHEHLPG